MRRIATALTLAAFVAGLYACSADAPNPTLPKGGGGASKALVVTLFTNNANPTAGFCSLIQAVVTLNGASVPDGTGVSFSTDFGQFEENSLPLVTKPTQNGTAATAVCSSAVGVAKVKASVTVGSATASATISISFQPSAQAVPFFSFCSPNFGANTGGTVLTITGGRFFGSASTTRVQFTSMGVTREGVVQTVTATTVTVLTPAFPEAVSPSVPVDITVTFGTNTGSPVTLSAPSCFVYGTAAGDQPTITAVLPTTGSNDGGTRVTIIGSGFVAPVQVFFGTVEAPPPTSVTYNQIVVLSPPATPQSGQVNATVTIRVHGVNSGKDGTLAAAFTYVTKLLITAIENGTQSVDALSPVTIFGQGFSSPVAVSLAGVAATPMSVSNTELVVMPSVPLLTSCTNLQGKVSVTNINSGDSTDSGSLLFIYIVQKPVINSVSPSSAEWVPGLTMTITGSGFPASISDVQVTIGTRTAAVISTSPTSIIVGVPNNGITVSPTCGAGQPPLTQVPTETDSVTVTNLRTTCSVTAASAFSYTRPCS